MTKGIVTGGSQQTVDAGAAMLRRGGNAVDAVVAATFASYLGDIMLSSPGGGGYAILSAPGRDPLVYDFFCVTPGQGEDRRRADMDFAPVTVVYESGTSIYHLGRASSAVPGDIAGLCRLLDDAGTLPLSVVVEPAIRLAREGFTLSDYQAYLIRLVDVIFDFDPSCRTIFAPEDEWLKPGERLVNPNLAESLEQIAANGADAFYTGDIAARILADQREHGGLITAADLAAYEVLTHAPLTFRYGGHTVYTPPPPSAGGILIAYALNLLARANLSDWAHNGADHAALLAEIMRQVGVARHRDRPARLPDAESWAAWLSEAAQASDWAAVVAALAESGPRIDPGEPPTKTTTTHISVIDESGLAVGLTTSNGETAGYIPGGTGMLMNNMLGEEELSPDGFHHWQPGTRMASMMAPTLVQDDDGLQIVLGSGGAARLRSAIFQAVSNLLDWSLSVHDAANAPRVHLEDGVLHVEGGFALAADALDARGYTVNRWPGRAFYFGGTHIAMRLPDGSLHAAGDSRRGGSVAVVE